MPVIVVANPKGGVGKSTLATNLAGWLARQGQAVMLGDVDRQQSSRQWLDIRPPQLPPIRGWDVDAAEIARPPKGTTHLVLDTPAGLKGRRLEAVMRIAEQLLIPLQPSLFDIQATHAFVQSLLAHPRWWRCGSRSTPTPTSTCTNSSPASRCRWWPNCATLRTTCTWPRAG
jgi:chromosome partitioning protein